MMKSVAQMKRYQSGFSLIEIMVVLIIIGILITFVAPRVLDRPDEARIVKVKHDLKTLEGALQMYKLHNYNYPSTEQGLEALVEKPSGSPEPKNWKGYMPKLPKDPWGNDYQYLQPGTHGDVDIYSLGADNRLGGDGINADIGNWDLEG
ncbi:MAG: type II secretion system major pseudopilin GspG [Gammaproteobacteria bacterium]|nr:type II secretion system major pseudopilin GspG [Gammaproteobacteria bacterium]